MNILSRFLFCSVLFLCGCSPGYVLRAAYEQGKILMNREDIVDALKDPAITEDHKTKLTYVLEARDFAARLGLKPKESFTKFAVVDREVLSWVVMGCKKDAFLMRTWWFPFVGTVPYKGYFEKEDALSEAKALEQDGYETWVRGTDAFSTLGWFNDPVLTTTLRNPVPSIVNTVIHEIVHTTFWFKGSVPFNETLANYIGTQGAVLFFEEKLKRCGSDTGCRAGIMPLLAESQTSLSRSLELTTTLSALYEKLDALYTSGKTSEEKIRERVQIFEAAILPLRQKYPSMKSFASINNAEIMQLRIYLTQYDLFHTQFQKYRNLSQFISSIRELVSAYTDGQDPFLLMAGKEA